MLELRFIRENTELVKNKMEHRGLDSSKVDTFVTIDVDRRQLLSEVEGLRNKRKTVSQEVAKLKSQKQAADELMQDMREVGATIKELEKKLSVADP